MSDNPNKINKTILEKQLCIRAGYLPIPLKHVTPASLAGIDIFLLKNNEYVLYSVVDLQFGPQDAERLRENGIEFVYVSVQEHQRYYQTLEKHLATIIGDEKIRQKAKAQMLYSTSLHLVDELLEAPPGQAEIARAETMARSVVELVMQNQDSFGRLMEISNHDFYTATHMVNVCTTSVSVAQEMGLTDRTLLQHLATGALLHDIGKIFIPTELLNKKGMLTAEEYRTLQGHVERGIKHLDSVTDLNPLVRNIILEHHERMDGSGYPQGLERNEVSLFGRIVGVVDTFDAMTAIRPYKERGCTVGESIYHLQKNTPAMYDAAVVKGLRQLLERTKPELLLQEAETAAPLRPNRRHERVYFRMGVVVRKIIGKGKELTLGPGHKIIAHNISCSGIGFLAPARFSADDNLVIMIPELSTMPGLNLLGVVVHCQDHADGWYSVGCEFHKVQHNSLVEGIRQGRPMAAEKV